MKGVKHAGLVHCVHKEKCVHTGGTKDAGNRWKMPEKIEDVQGLAVYYRKTAPDGI